jgi:hypothetical protein
LNEVLKTVRAKWYDLSKDASVLMDTQAILVRSAQRALGEKTTLFKEACVCPVTATDTRLCVTLSQENAGYVA